MHELKKLNGLCKLSESAKKLIKAQGLISFKFTDLASDVGCSTSKIYNDFKCKEDVVLTVFNSFLKGLLSANEKLFSKNHLSAKEKLYISFLAEPLSLAAEKQTSADSICNFFALNGAVSSFADPCLTTESFLLLKMLRKQYMSVLSEAMKNGELCSMTDDDFSMHYLRIVTSSRGLVALSMNMFNDQLNWKICNNSIYSILSTEIESFPWSDKRKPSADLITSEVSAFLLLQNEFAKS